MKDLRAVQKKQNIWWLKTKTYLKKNWKVILVLTIIAIMIVFPTQSGQVVGQWIHDFFGTLLKFAKF